MKKTRKRLKRKRNCKYIQFLFHNSREERNPLKILTLRKKRKLFKDVESINLEQRRNQPHLYFTLRRNASNLLSSFHEFYPLVYGRATHFLFRYQCLFYNGCLKSNLALLARALQYVRIAGSVIQYTMSYFPYIHDKRTILQGTINAY